MMLHHYFLAVLWLAVAVFFVLDHADYRRAKRERERMERWRTKYAVRQSDNLNGRVEK